MKYAYRFVSCDSARSDGLTATHYMTIVEIVTRRRWLFWRVKTERTVVAFLSPACSRWRQLDTGFYYKDDPSNTFDCFLAAHLEQERYSALLDRRIAAAETDGKVIPLRRDRSS